MSYNLNDTLSTSLKWVELKASFRANSKRWATHHENRNQGNSSLKSACIPLPAPLFVLHPSPPRPMGTGGNPSSCGSSMFSSDLLNTASTPWASQLVKFPVDRNHSYFDHWLQVITWLGLSWGRVEVKDEYCLLFDDCVVSGWVKQDAIELWFTYIFSQLGKNFVCLKWNKVCCCCPVTVHWAVWHTVPFPQSNEFFIFCEWQFFFDDKVRYVLVKLTTYFAFQCNTMISPLSFLDITGKPGSCFVPCQVLGFPPFHCRTGEFSWCYLSRVRLHRSFKVTLVGIHLFGTDTFRADFNIAFWFHLIVWSFDWFLGGPSTLEKNW